MYKTPESVQLLSSTDPTGTDSLTRLPTLLARDPEGSVTGLTPALPDSRIKWSLSGPDAGRFEIVTLPGDSTVALDIGETDGYVRGALRWMKSPYPNFEDMDSADGDNVYEVVVTATDGGVLRNSNDVTVTVENYQKRPVVCPCRSAGRRRGCR